MRSTTLLIFALCFMHSLARADTPNTNIADRIANIVQGRLIYETGVISIAKKVSGRVEKGGALTLELEVDPLIEVQSVPGPRDSNGGGTPFYVVSIEPAAKCGVPDKARKISSTDFSVRKGSQFLNLREALKDLVPNLPGFGSADQPLVIRDADLSRVRECLTEVNAKLDSIPFETIRVYVDDVQLSEVHRPTEKSTTQDRNIDIYGRISHIKIIPKVGNIEVFSVDVQALSSMSCSFEGPHYELDEWKQGQSEPKALRRNGNDFYASTEVINDRVPDFPAYTQQELRQALGKRLSGKKMMASTSETKSCGLILRGHTFTIKYGERTVHKITLLFTGA